MKLNHYVKNIRKIPIKQAATELGEEYETVRTWMRGTAIPSKPKMAKITTWSGYLVQPNDFYDLKLPKREGVPAGQIDMFTREACL